MFKTGYRRLFLLFELIWLVVVISFGWGKYKSLFQEYGNWMSQSYGLLPFYKACVRSVPIELYINWVYKGAYHYQKLKNNKKYKDRYENFLHRLSSIKRYYGKEFYDNFNVDTKRSDIPPLSVWKIK